MAKKKSDDQLIEDGLALVARGLFRTATTQPRDAYDKGMTVVSIVRSMAFEFLKKEQNR